MLQELERSDLMVLIVGHRYGSIEPGSGIGWVEAEFRAARRLGKPIFAFLADDQAPFPPHNAPMESCFGTLKTELVHLACYPTPDAARHDLFAYIEGYYNRQRLHSALGYITPEQAERQAA
jgi:transposase InsO family protein